MPNAQGPNHGQFARGSFYRRDDQQVDWRAGRLELEAELLAHRVTHAALI